VKGHYGGPAQAKEDTTSSLRARNVGTPATLGHVTPIDQKRRKKKRYTWMTCHYVRDLFGTSGLKEGAARTVGEESQ
jgi:hypothetical protein